MDGADAAAEGGGLATGSPPYQRFITVSDARTGSHMLAQALNSSPHITCFREVFNDLLDHIQYGVEGYDDFSSRDMALREEEPVRFLQERIFCQQPGEIRAVGFKYHYEHVWSFAGVMDSLAEDAEIRVVHLKRRNLLRTLVSLRMAQTTGLWMERGRPKPPLQARMLTAARHPLRAAVRLGRLLRPPEARQKPPRARVTLSVDECWSFFNRMQAAVTHFDYVFRDHPKLNVYYEDLLQRRDEVFDQVQLFLGVEPGPLTVTLRRQNPQPLRELVENYDELYEVFRGTPYAVFFE